MSDKIPVYRPGDHVKVEFANADSSDSEWMWIRVDSVDCEHRLVFGKLDSQPVVHTELKLGQDLAISFDKIRDHRKFGGG